MSKLYGLRTPDSEAQFNESYHGGLESSSYGAGQQISQPTVVQSLTEFHPHSQPPSSMGIRPSSDVGTRPRRWSRTVWCRVTVVVVILLLLGAILGGSLGGTLPARKKADNAILAAPTKPSNYLGCYFDDSARALRDLALTNSSMTPRLCNSYCHEFSYYALEYATQCFCGDQFHDGYPKVSERDCNANCGGDIAATCGGSGRLSLYSFVADQGPPIVNFTSLGCFTDKPTRALADAYYADGQMTRQLCAGLCGKYRYAGAEFGAQCFCGNSLPSGYPKLNDSDCDMNCAGDPSAVCGGQQKLNVLSVG